MDTAADGAPDPEIGPRALWTLFEPLHAVTYFAPQARTAFEAAGLRGYWRGYFAGRAAPLGAVGPEPVVAAFFGFAPRMAARGLPALWRTTPPEQALQARLAGATAALTHLLTGQEEAVARAGETLLPAALGLDCSGRVLAAANTALDVPEDPYGRLWHAATLLREHRGDGHVAALVAAGLDGCETLALRAGTDLPRDELQPYRGWTDEEWAAAQQRLVERGWLTPEGTATAAGRQVLASVEEATDRAARRPWQALGAERTRRVAALLRPLAHACGAALRFPNPMGLPRTTPAAEGE
ncbi:SCO6745 family protein [Streptomyces palmae]|uniref:SalK n=2 Tax=Streptomyces palmae TaxID=1701085 RepID=A0A4Z0HB26_9ACTN|nr:hypothetical protein [Streptomyces palmae]TGB12669.1 hypothetical protein E4099_10935 [Streptomyces palmae]